MNELDKVLIIAHGKPTWITYGLLSPGNTYFREVPLVRNCPGDRKFMVRIFNEGYLCTKSEALLFDETPAVIYREYTR